MFIFLDFQKTVTNNVSLMTGPSDAWIVLEGERMDEYFL